jgi:hypothetical protein
MSSLSMATVPPVWPDVRTVAIAVKTARPTPRINPADSVLTLMSPAFLLDARQE